MGREDVVVASLETRHPTVVSFCSCAVADFRLRGREDPVLVGWSAALMVVPDAARGPGGGRERKTADIFKDQKQFIDC